DRGEKTA
ncbi:hypothetical protein D046_8187B, partial [Vibrio parahaemolyticus V-223/04]